MSPDRQHSDTPRHILSGGAVAPREPVPVDDPYRVLDDLMAVIEALCPVWPPREIGGPMDNLRL